MEHDSELLVECQALVRAVEPFRSLSALRASPRWGEIAPRVARVLSRIRTFEPLDGVAPTTQPDRIKAAHWNIEHGNRHQQVEAALLGNEELRDADLIYLNEVDFGMARSGNLDIAGHLARTLGRYGVWAPLFLETTSGRDDDNGLAAGRTNQEGLFGLALLSRWPLREVRVVELPSPDTYQFDVERMLGRHIAVIATVDRPGAPFVAAAAHIEVHRTRAHRAAQMRTLLATLAAEQRPVLLAGDFNTHTFDRGRPWDPLLGVAVLALAPQRLLTHRLLFPDHGGTREPLFDELKRGGFRWTKLVDRSPTLQLRFDRIDELRAFPDFVARGVRSALSWAERRGRLRLDWFASRGFGGGRGYTVHGLDGPGRASDHAPIVCELW